MSSKVVSNLLYYQVELSHSPSRSGTVCFQTNYFVCVASIVLLVFFFVPWKMFYIAILLAIGNFNLFKKVLK